MCHVRIRIDRSDGNPVVTAGSDDEYGVGDDLVGKRWRTREEAGKYLGANPRTLANWAAKGHGPRYSKPSGKSCMYRLADLDALLEAHTVHTEDQPGAA